MGIATGCCYVHDVHAESEAEAAIALHFPEPIKHVRNCNQLLLLKLQCFKNIIQNYQKNCKPQGLLKKQRSQIYFQVKINRCCCCTIRSPLLDNDIIYIAPVSSVRAGSAVNAQQGRSIHFLHLLLAVFAA